MHTDVQVTLMLCLNGVWHLFLLNCVTCGTFLCLELEYFNKFGKALRSDWSVKLNGNRYHVDEKWAVVFVGVLLS